MKIAILGSVALPVPPTKQGGTEAIAYYQAVNLATRGHKIILFAAAGSKDSIKKAHGSIPENLEIIEVGGGDVFTKYKGQLNIESSRSLRLENIYLGQVIEALLARRADFDIILNNMRGEAVFLPIAKLLTKPFVNIMHLNLFDELAKTFAKYNTHIITISNAQRKNYPDLNYLATVYNCVDTDKYSFEAKKENYLLMMGTIGTHKNQAVAVKVAKKLDMKLVLAGKIRDQDYFDKEIKPFLGDKLEWLGELEFDKKLKLYQKAKAFIFPINWPEPFGLVMIEAMSCGTPVVAFDNGAVPEVVKDGFSGFVVENENEMTSEKKKIDKIKPINCRQHVLDNIKDEKMIDSYQKALEKLERK